MELAQATLQEFLVAHVFAFILSFLRIGTAFMVMPGLGDAFIAARIRLLLALGISFVLLPVTQPYMPVGVPSMFVLVPILLIEFVTGLFIGTISRILMGALDTAGTVISLQSGFANAQLFNPALSAQTSIFSSFLTIAGAVILFSTNMHHLLIAAVVESYEMFPVGGLPDVGGMAQMVAHAVTAAFSIGVKMAAPFLVMVLLLYVGIGILSRLMPQIHVLQVILPLQIWMAMLLFMFVISGMMVYWASEFESGMVFFIRQAGG